MDQDKTRSCCELSHLGLTPIELNFTHQSPGIGLPRSININFIFQKEGKEEGSLCTDGNIRCCLGALM